MVQQGMAVRMYQRMARLHQVMAMYASRNGYVCIKEWLWSHQGMAMDALRNGYGFSKECLGMYQGMPNYVSRNG